MFFAICGSTCCAELDTKLFRVVTVVGPRVIPYETAEEAQRRRDEATRKEIELLRRGYERRERLIKEMNEMTGMPADHGTLKDAEPTTRDDLADSVGFFRRAASKLFGAL